MRNFMAGLAGIGLGFMIFMPSYLFASEAVGSSGFAEIPSAYKFPLVTGLVIMYFSPVLFWILVPLWSRLSS